jgi:hypothetical protein
LSTARSERTARGRHAVLLTSVRPRCPCRLHSRMSDHRELESALAAWAGAEIIGALNASAGTRIGPAGSTPRFQSKALAPQEPGWHDSLGVSACNRLHESYTLSLEVGGAEYGKEEKEGASRRAAPSEATRLGVPESSKSGKHSETPARAPH